MFKKMMKSKFNDTTLKVSIVFNDDTKLFFLSDSKCKLGKASVYITPVGYSYVVPNAIVKSIEETPCDIRDFENDDIEYDEVD